MAEGKTKTEIQALSEEESIEELARLLGGEERDDASVEHARSLKKKAKSGVCRFLPKEKEESKRVRRTG